MAKFIDSKEKDRMSKALRKKRQNLVVKWIFLIVLTALAALISGVMVWGVLNQFPDTKNIVIQANMYSSVTATFLLVGLFLGMILSEFIVFMAEISKLDPKLNDAIFTEKVEEILKKKLAQGEKEDGSPSTANTKA